MSTIFDAIRNLNLTGAATLDTSDEVVFVNAADRQAYKATVAQLDATGGALTNKVIDSYTNLVGADHLHYKIKATVNIVKGDVLRVVGYNAGEQAVEVAKYSAAEHIAVGIANNTLATGEFGLAIHTGLIVGIKTDYAGWALGDILYPDPANPGGLTKTRPSSGQYQACAFVLRVQQNNGVLLCEFTEPQIVESSANTALTLVYRDATGGFAMGPLQVSPGAIATPSVNGSVVLELTNNTTLTLKAKGSDGVVRSVALTLAP